MASIPRYKVSNVSIAWVPGSDNKQVYAKWSFGHKHLKEYEVKWYYMVVKSYKSGKKTKYKQVWFEGSSGTTTRKQTEPYSVPDTAYKVKVKVKPVATTHKVNKKDQVYFKGGWKEGSKDIRKVNLKPEIPTSYSGTMTSFKNMLCVAEAPDDYTTHIEFQVYRPAQNGHKDGWDGGNGLIKIDNQGVARFNKTIAYPGYGYQVRVRAYNGDPKANLYSDWSELEPRNDMIATVPYPPKNVKAIVTKQSTEGVDRDSLTVTWTQTYKATKYQVQYTSNENGWDNSSLYTIVDTDGPTGRMIIDGLTVGHKYWIRVRAVNEDATWDNPNNLPRQQGSSEWSSTVTAIVSKPPSPPTTWSSRLTAEIGQTVDLFWVHNSTDESQLSESKVWYKVGDRAAQEVTVKPTYDNALDMFSPRGQWPLNTSGFPDQSKVQWKVRTKGIDPNYSDYSVTREISIFQPPKLNLFVSDSETSNGTSLEEITEYPFYILLDADPPTQRAIGFYVEIAPETSFKTVNPDGTERWVNAGEPVYSEFFDFDSSSGIVTVGDYAVINGNSMYVKITPDKMSVPIDIVEDGPGVQFNVNASVSMNSGLSATAAESFGTNFSDLDFQADGDVTLDYELLCASILPDCRKKFVYEEGVDYPDDFVPPEQPPAPNTSLAVYRCEQNGEFTLVESGISSEMPVSATDPHPSLRGVIYRIVATSDITGQVVYTDLEPEDLEENGIVIQWNEEWTWTTTNDTYDENGELVEVDEDIESPWSGMMVKLPANIDIQNKTSPDVELAKYDGRKRPVSYFGTQLGETGTWSGVFPKSDKETIAKLRQLQAWTGNVYVREPSGLGYWATVTVDMPVNHLELVVPVTLNLTRVEGGL